MEKDITKKERQKDQLKIECSIMEEKRDVDERLQSDSKQDMFHLPQNQAEECSMDATSKQAPHQTITSQTEQAMFTSKISPIVTSKSGNIQFDNAFDFNVSFSVLLILL